MKTIIIIFSFFLLSCSSKWETEDINKFLSDKKIDTTKYHTYDELNAKGLITKIKTMNCNENAYIFNLLVSENECVYI
ncbi:hypothetical protein, partial [Flavobacterium sp.]|uniref:hypothetical protein n=1 Tax=Flavobacterium sp. TaxID=239 RepID=UPI0037C06E3F